MELRNNKKGVSLIIVIFAILLFAGLVWTLMSTQSGEVESNMRAFDSEKALYVAEAGAQYGMEKLTLDSTWRTSSGTTCANWELHTLSPGQYRVCSRNPGVGESGESVIEAEGYVPSYASYLAKRKVKLAMSRGGLSRAAQVRSLLNWSGAASRNPLIYGDVGVTNAYPDNLHDGYEGNGNSVHNQLLDVDPNLAALKPPGSGARDLLPNDSGFPMINMNEIENNCGATVWNPGRAGGISAISAAGGKSTLTFDNANMFNAVPQSQYAGQAVRNTTMGSWQSGSWGIIESVESAATCILTSAVNWTPPSGDPNARGDRVCVVPKIASITIAGSDEDWNKNPKRTYEIIFDCNVPFTVGTVARNFSGMERNFRQKIWDYRDWGEITSVSTTANTTTIQVQFDSSVGSAPGWQVNDWVGEALCLSGNNNNTKMFIRGDMLYDLRNGGANCNTSFFTAEGDIGLMGSGGITIKAHVKTSANETLPNVSSRNGSIYSYSNTTAGCRVFQGVVYTYNGDVTFDSINGTSVFGYNVTFSGFLNLNYANWSNYIDSDGFYASISTPSWSEEQ